MSGDACTGGAAEVEAEVEAVRLIGRLHRYDAVVYRRPEASTLVAGQLLQLSHVTARHHEDVAGGVGIGVEDDDRRLVRPHDMTLLVGCR
jgi:hypothetical protein